MHAAEGEIGDGLGLVAGVLGKYMIDAIVTLDLQQLIPCCVLTVVSAVLGVAAGYLLPLGI